MKVTVIGSGYVGLVTGACLADVGNDVLCIDVDSNKINALRAGVIPIYEPGLDSKVLKNVQSGRLTFSDNEIEGALHGIVQIIAVGTPPGENGSADLSYVLAAAENIAKSRNEFCVVVDKSTVPVGTGDKVEQHMKTVLAAMGKSLDFAVVSNPEFLKEGAAIEDFLKPERIVIGSDEPRAIDLMKQLYAPFQRNHDKVIVMGRRSAELTKYAANAMLATRISFMNEMAAIADAAGADIEDVRRGIGSDSRIGYSFLYAGTGYGGSCFPKDVRAANQTAKELNLSLRILPAVEQVNEDQKLTLFRKAKTKFKSIAGMRFALWGLAFKPNTDDMREAPSITLINALLSEGASISAYDPVVNGSESTYLPRSSNLTFCSTANEALAGADALFIVTEWQEFRSPDFEKIKNSLKLRTIFDGRNLYAPQTVADHGIEYFGVGRGLNCKQ